ncbi:MAG: hypothetical protein V8S95_08940 [Odoribacter sp.]
MMQAEVQKKLVITQQKQPTASVTRGGDGLPGADFPLTGSECEIDLSAWSLPPGIMLTGYGCTALCFDLTDGFDHSGLHPDFKDDAHPMMHVRTWQSGKYDDGSEVPEDEVFSFSDFEC